MQLKTVGNASILLKKQSPSDDAGPAPKESVCGPILMLSLFIHEYVPVMYIYLSSLHVS